jgi:hypothetical protein
VNDGADRLSIRPSILKPSESSTSQVVRSRFFLLTLTLVLTLVQSSSDHGRSRLRLRLRFAVHCSFKIGFTVYIGRSRRVCVSICLTLSICLSIDLRMYFFLLRSLTILSYLIPLFFPGVASTAQL